MMSLTEHLEIAASKPNMDEDSMNYPVSIYHTVHNCGQRVVLELWKPITVDYGAVFPQQSFDSRCNTAHGSVFKAGHTDLPLFKYQSYR